VIQTIRVAVVWDGRTWQDVGNVIEFEESAELLADAGGGFRPRRIRFTMDLGPAVDWVAEGHHHHTAHVSATIGSEIVFFGGVTSFLPGRDGELSEFECMGADLGMAQIPSGSVVEIQQIDVEATNADRTAWREAVVAEMNDGIWRNQEPVEVVFVNEYTSEKRWAKIQEKYNAARVLPPKFGVTPWRPLYDYVEEGSFIRLADKSEGLLYPWIFGQPGCENGQPAVRAYVVDITNRILLLAGHHATAGTVTIYGPKKNAPQVWQRETFNAYNGFDDAGRPCLLVDISAATDVEANWSSKPEAAEQDWFAIFDGTAAGLPNGAADMLAILLSHGGGAVDYASIENVRGHLRGYTFDGVLEARVAAEALLYQSILPLLPIALTPSLFGLSIVPVRLDATAADARFELVEGRDFDQVGRPQYRRSSEIANAITFRYAPNRRSGKTSRTAFATSGTHAEAARSQQIHGPIPEEVESAWVHRQAVADRVARNIMLRRAVDRREIEIAVASERWGLGGANELRLGDVVTVTIPDEAIVDAVALVSSITRNGGPADAVRLLLL
jgi:hypothetical protein